MRTCILCGCKTEVSIGAAGLKWKNLCQPCKDEEDGALKINLQVMNSVVKQAENLFIKLLRKP